MEALLSLDKVLGAGWSRILLSSRVCNIVFRKGLPEAAAFIEQCVLEVRKNGDVDSWIEKYGVSGKLSTPN